MTRRVVRYRPERRRWTVDPASDERTYAAGTMIVPTDGNQIDKEQYIRHHRASLVEVHYSGVDFCSFLVAEVSCVYARYEG